MVVVVVVVFLNGLVWDEEGLLRVVNVLAFNVIGYWNEVGLLLGG